MKVKGPHPDVVVDGMPKAPDAGPTDGSGAFDRILAQELDPDGTPEVTASELRPAAGPMGLLSPEVRTSGVEAAQEHIQGVLDELDNLSQQLMEGGPYWKGVDERLRNLEASAEQAWKATQDLAPGHPLRQLAEEARVVAYVESVKWARGDYLGS
ncbi:hypothetical protein SAMN02746041_00681 [Desulfacinum hydrothermale DSM 13146]|uniref:Uncharacterized protein n=1 Tax=Desulfacinum hydrothermale DSM 13146 TaxID=1121390 RepID=A0A1W1X6I2_9BACT|nr:hypothetical protein [Desulfacinum hydrothermale]SMC19454.1 hypothetical protein SAMN02746041_00681 [Desulfacinum hydrothermale DSM 13146]